MKRNNNRKMEYAKEMKEIAEIERSFNKSFNEIMRCLHS